MRSLVRFAGAAALSLGSAAGAQSPTFASLAGRTGLPVRRLEIDWPHSAVEFTVGFMGFSTVRGQFASFGGTVMYDSANVENSSVTVYIDAGKGYRQGYFPKDTVVSAIAPVYSDADEYLFSYFQSTSTTNQGP